MLLMIWLQELKLLLLRSLIVDTLNQQIKQQINVKESIIISIYN